VTPLLVNYDTFTLDWSDQPSIFRTSFCGFHNFHGLNEKILENRA
jgi:hypothetical protein